MNILNRLYSLIPVNMSGTEKTAKIVSWQGWKYFNPQRSIWRFSWMKDLTKTGVTSISRGQPIYSFTRSDPAAYQIFQTDYFKILTSELITYDATDCMLELERKQAIIPPEGRKISNNKYCCFGSISGWINACPSNDRAAAFVHF